MPAIRATVKRGKSQPPFELELRRAHNTHVYGELTLSDLYTLRDALLDALDEFDPEAKGA